MISPGRKAQNLSAIHVKQLFTMLREHLQIFKYLQDEEKHR